MAWLALALVAYAHAEDLSPTRVSLPDGPGSIEGLGRTYEPSLGTGSMNFAVPIEVPPGAGDLAPELSLRYDSASGDSSLGLGWDLAGVPAVRVRTADGLPRFDGRDALEVVGLGPSSPLVAIDERTYRAREEAGSFVRVVRSADGASFEARDRSRRVYTFGGDTVEAEGARVVTWLLRETADFHGHRVRYEWQIERGVGLLSRIVYNDYAPELRNTIDFEWEERPDARSSFASGIRQAMLRRLTGIVVRSGGALVRSYRLAYHDGPRSRLASIRVIGADGVSMRPGLAFEYTATSSEPEVVTMRGSPGRSPLDPDVGLVDLDGDSLLDIVVASTGAYRSYRNVDGRTFEAGVDWAATESPSVSLGEEGSTFADFDGDGALDLIVRSGISVLRYLPLDARGRFQPSVAIRTVPNLDFDDADVALVDLDGDRRVDFFATSSTGTAAAFNVGGTDFTVPRALGAIDPREPVRLSSRGTSLCEVNGDGVADLCRLRSDGMVFFLGRGRGAFETGVPATGVPAMTLANPYSLADIDGDGLDDLVRPGLGHVELARASGVGSYGPIERIALSFSRRPETYAGLHDMNGSGTTDVVFIDPAAPSDGVRYVELSPSGRAGLLRRIVDERGSETELEYEPAVLGTARLPAMEPGAARMNVAMPVLARVTTRTSMPGDPASIEELAYGGGAWSARDRSFGGFTIASRRSVGDETAAGRVTIQRLDPGLDHVALRGQPLEEEVRSDGGALLSRTIYAYSRRDVAHDRAGRAVTYAYRSSEEVHNFEGAPDARVALTEYEHDDYGNTIAERRWGEVIGDDRRAGNDESVAIKTYALNLDDWILGLVASEEVQDADGDTRSRRRTYYDGEPFVGLPLGEVSRGNASRVEEWVSGDSWQTVTATAYDADGHPVEVRDGEGGARRFEWDALDHTFLLREAVVLADRTLEFRVRHERAFGKIVEAVDFGGVRTEYRYDAFGRLASVVRPGDTPELPTIAYEYVEESPLSRVVTIGRRASGGVEVDRREDLYDGLGRKRGSLVFGERIALRDAVFYDARGTVRHRDDPRFVDDVMAALSEPGSGTAMEYDALGRTVRETTALGIVRRTEHGPWYTARWDGAQSDPSSRREHTPTIVRRDGLDRVVAIEETLAGDSLIARFEWDAADELIARIDPGGHRASYRYDGRGRRTGVSDPDAGEHTFAFDARGNEVEHARPDGTTQRMTYDAAGRRVGIDLDGDGTLEAAFEWDRVHGGKLARAIDPAGTVDYEYDARGRVAFEHRTVDGERWSSGTRWDAQDRAIAHVYPDGSIALTTLDGAGRVTSIGSIVALDRDAGGLVTAQRFSSGLSIEHEYDGDRRRVGVRARNAERTIAAERWTLDGAGTLEAIADDAPGEVDRSLVAEHDNLDRLVATQAGESVLRSYTADTSLAMRSGETFEYGDAHAPIRAGGRAIAWDAAGRIAGDGERSFSWGPGDRLLRVEHASGASVENVFGADGRRVLRRERRASGSTSETIFLDDFSEVRDGALVRYAVLDGQRIARIDGAAAAEGVAIPRPPFWPVLFAVALVLLAASFTKLRRLSLATSLALACGGDPEPFELGEHSRIFLHDRVGTLTKVLAPDGRIDAVFDADAFGAPRRDTTSETRRFAGYVRDASVGVDMSDARAYLPDLELFASVDPVLVAEPERQAEDETLIAAAYTYASASPLSNVDPDGNWVFEIGTFVGGSTPLAGPGGSVQAGIAIEFKGLKPVAVASYVQVSGGVHAGPGGVSFGVTAGIVANTNGSRPADLSTDFSGHSTQWTAGVADGPGGGASFGQTYPSGALTVNASLGVGFEADAGREAGYTWLGKTKEVGGWSDLPRAIVDVLRPR